MITYFYCLGNLVNILWFDDSLKQKKNVRQIFSFDSGLKPTANISFLNQIRTGISTVLEP